MGAIAGRLTDAETREQGSSKKEHFSCRAVSSELVEIEMAIGFTCCAMPHGNNLVVIQNQVTIYLEIKD